MIDRRRLEWKAVPACILLSLLCLPKSGAAQVGAPEGLTGAMDREGNTAPPRQGVMQILGARQADGWRIIAAQNTNQAQPQ